MAHTQVLYVDPDLGRIWVPPDLLKLVSLPGRPVRPKYGPGEVGVFVAKQRRPVVEDGFTRAMRLIWHSITHNERVDAGASQQAKQVFGGGASPAAPSATVFPSVIAVASAALTKAKTDQSLGSASAGVTTNEFTTIGLSRAAADARVAGDYTLPGTLGGTFAQQLKKTFTASGTGTAHGAGAFDSTTVAGSVLYVEDNFSTSASLVSSDTLAITITINN